MKIGFSSSGTHFYPPVAKTGKPTGYIGIGGVMLPKTAEIERIFAEHYAGVSGTVETLKPASAPVKKAESLNIIGRLKITAEKFLSKTHW